MSREAVLLQWERKIRDAERRESGRFDLEADDDRPLAKSPPLRPAEDATSPGERRFEQSAARAAQQAPVTERRTVTIAGQRTPVGRRLPVVQAQMAQPDRIALWAFLLGLFLVAVAAGTAHT